MSPEALVRVLPREFDPWVDGAPLRGEALPDDDSEERGGVRASARVHDQKRSPEDDRSADPAEQDTHDLKLQRWEQQVRRNGLGTMRYKRFHARVGVDRATGALEGRVMSPDSGRIKIVSAPSAAEFKKAMRREVNAYLQRGS
ncbi:MAG: hypothetical protein OXN92_17235 [Gammaproteobacteria bacterium]|nr:hypothetical protein [Gammaproteobacteria bacterium]